MYDNLIPTSRVDKALNAQNRKLPEGRPENKYSELLHNKFSNIFGTPKWANLKKEEDADSDESDHEVFKVRISGQSSFMLYIFINYW